VPISTLFYPLLEKLLSLSDDGKVYRTFLFHSQLDPFAPLDRLSAERGQASLKSLKKSVVFF
jgi:hypothetical protein